MTDFSSGARPLDRNSPLPLWAQLEAELRRRMDAGEFVKRFPTDRELIEIYRVSRHTARHAVGHLGADGIVRRARGKGTSIDQRTFERSLGALYSLFQVVEESGLPQHSLVRELKIVRDANAAEHLGVESDADLVFLDRIRYAGDDAIGLDQVWLPANLAKPLLKSDFSRTSLYNELAASAGVRPTDGEERIRPKIPTEHERYVLGLNDDEAVFAIERLGRHQGAALEWRVMTIRGSWFSFAADWSTGQLNEIQFQMHSPVTSES